MNVAGVVDAQGNVHDRVGRFAGRDVVEAAPDALIVAPRPAPPPEASVRDVPAWALGAAKARIAEANRRLERAGIEERFTYTTAEHVVTTTGEDGHRRHEPYVLITLNQPMIAHAGHTFLAALDQAEAGLVTRTAPGVDLGGWRPDQMKCEHCGRAQARTKTYLVQTPDGRRVQLGSTCVEAYLGIKPRGLWAIGHDPLEDDSFLSDGPGGGQYVQPVREVLAMALAVSDQGRGFVSRGRADATGQVSTSEVMNSVWYDRPRTDGDARYHAQMHDLAAKLESEGAVDALLAAIEQDVDASSDWGANLRTAVAGEWTGHRQVALIASAVSVWARRVEREQYVAPTPGFAADAGTKVKGWKVRVTKVRHTTDYDPYRRTQITKSMVILRDQDGHELKWWASSEQDLQEGQELTLTGGSVKKNEVYQGVDQSVLTRVKWESATA